MVHIDTLVLSGTEWFDFILYIMEQDDVASAHMVQNGFLLSAFSWYKMVQNEAVQILYYRKLSSVCCGLPYGVPGGTSNKRKEALFVTRIRARTAVTDFAVSAQPVSQHLFHGTQRWMLVSGLLNFFKISLSKLTLTAFAAMLCTNQWWATTQLDHQYIISTTLSRPCRHYHCMHASHCDNSIEVQICVSRAY